MSDELSDTAHRILAAATAILVSEGYEAISMRRVAAAVGLSQAAIYRHYKDKADLVDRIVSSGYQALLARIEAAYDLGGRPSDLVKRCIAEYLGFALDNADVFKAVLLRDAGPARKRVEGLTPGVSRTRRSFGLLAEVIERGMADHEFAVADPELTAQAVWAAMFGLAARAVLEPEVPEARRAALIERHSEIIVRGLRL